MKSLILNQKGGALLIVLAIMVMLSLAAIMAVDTAHNDIELSFNQLFSDQAFYVAEAGLARAFVQINEDSTWNAGYAEVAFESGWYSVAVVDSTVQPDLADTIILRSTGIVEQARANLEAVLVPDYEHPFSYALFGDDSLTMNNNVCTDSYNSDSGSYGATRTYTDADIGSNGTITMTNSSLVGGDATSAVDDGIRMDHVADVIGDTVTGIDPTVFDLVDDSHYQWAENNSNAPAGFGGGGYIYNTTDKSLHVTQNQTMTLDGGVYYFSDITVENAAEIEIAPGEAAVIYMSGNLKLSQNSAVNPGGPPANLQIYSQGDNLTLGQNTELRAAFYGPNSDVVIDNNTDFYGSVMARRVEMRNGSCFHYDRALADIVSGQTGLKKMIAWKEL